MGYAFDYIKDNGGIQTEDSYPYEAADSSCRFDARYVGTTVTGYVRLPEDEKALMQAVASTGPIAVAIDASGFGSYKSGVFYDELCTPDGVNHAVLVVGYGTDEKYGDYWLVKNSWGTWWGEKGYIRMARNKNNNCEISSFAVVPTV